MSKTLPEAVNKQIHTRRTMAFVCLGLLLCVDLIATGLLGGGERQIAIFRSLVLPGLPFLEWHVPLGLITITLALSTLGAWLRWGMDWLVGLVWGGALIITATIMPLHHIAESPHDLVRASHEFAIVLVIFAGLGQLRLLLGGLPGFGNFADRFSNLVPQALRFQAVDIARTAAIQALTGAATIRLDDSRLIHRAAWINKIARFRFTNPILRGAHAPLRAALSLSGACRDALLVEDAQRGLAGVPASEPTWVRLLDGVLAALALADLGETDCVERWQVTLNERFALRHGHRAASLHTPSMLSLGTAPAWEHCVAAALAHSAGWVDDSDWHHLRARCLGAAASNKADRHNLRLIAAGKLWANMLNDQEAIDILARRATGGDELAAALERVDTRLETRMPIVETRRER